MSILTVKEILLKAAQQISKNPKRYNWYKTNSSACSYLIKLADLPEEKVEFWFINKERKDKVANLIGVHPVDFEELEHLSNFAICTELGLSRTHNLYTDSRITVKYLKQLAEVY